ncbi:MAG TPA: ATP-binding cassette domain-containing protein, partial [Longimicrobiales bacterium]|nr:ATP-binding cassette domain-containing protein [Longimicrobiales bacterium]
MAHLPQGLHLAPRHPGETVADRLGVAERLAALKRILDGGTDPGDYERVGTDGWDLGERIGAQLHALELGHLTPGRTVDGLSGGELARVSLAAAFLQGPDLLLLDEPTNDLDAPSREALLSALDSWKGGILVVSHHRDLLRRVDRILELTPSGLREYGGNYDHYTAVRDARDLAAREELEQARAARRRARADAREATERQARRTARGARSRREGSQPPLVLNARRERSQGTAGRLGAALGASVERADNRVSEAEARAAEAREIRMDVRPSGLPASRDVLALEGVGYYPPGASTPVLQGVSLRIRGPERVAVTGRNGSGKSTLLRLVAGDLLPEEGAVRLTLPRKRVVWMGQDGRVRPPGSDGFPGGPVHGERRSVLSTFLEAHPRVDEGQARHRLARYLFPGDSALTPLGALSGGERVRAALAVALAGDRTPWLLVLDEPTNHL